LVILLIMSVVLTIGLAITSRTVTDIEISEQTEEAARAFSAAEAGIEEALFTPGDFFEETIEEGVTYKTQKSGLGEEPNYLFSQTKEMNTLWLSDYPGYSSPYAANSLALLWGDSVLPEKPALEATVYYKTVGGETRVLRYALDPDPLSRDHTNNFCSPNLASGDCTRINSFDTGTFSIGGKQASYRTVLNLSDAGGSTLLFARLRFLYSDSESNQVLGAQAAGGSIFPSQGVKIESVGTAGTATRRVEVTRLHPAPPEIFDFLLYSESSL
jgi:hypothetical protein